MGLYNLSTQVNVLTSCISNAYTFLLQKTDLDKILNLFFKVLIILSDNRGAEYQARAYAIGRSVNWCNILEAN